MIAGLVVLALITPGRVMAQTAPSWLDQPLAKWNDPGMMIPVAPPARALPNEQCGSGRPVETIEDQAVSNAGWILSGPYQSGWGVRAVTGASGDIGQCRPAAVQSFIFSDGVFVGTIAPQPMEPRPDGIGQIRSFGRDSVLVVFQYRYATLDANCCPSGPSTEVQYSIARGDAGPVLIATAVQNLRR